jgi:hypothetical protein
MIDIWGGRYTQYDWFLRSERTDCRYEVVFLALEHYFALTGHFPETLDELSDIGFLPIRPRDPITGEVIHFDSSSDSRDYLNTTLSASATEWTISCPMAQFPTGQSRNYERHIDIGDMLHDEYLTKFPDVSSSRGSLFSELFNELTFDYYCRRNRMPADMDDLLDGLWFVNTKKFRDDKRIDLSGPGQFMFGLDPYMQMAVGIWTDHNNTKYFQTFGYSPWPVSGWIRVPDLKEWSERMNASILSCSDWRDIDPEQYRPPIILWRCCIE